MKWILFFLAILATVSLACSSGGAEEEVSVPLPENRTVIEDDGSIISSTESGEMIEVDEEIAPFASVTMKQVQSIQTVYDRIGLAQAGFTTDGDYLIHTAVDMGRGSDDHLIEFWNTSTWELDEIITRPGSGDIFDLEFDPNGRYFMISDENDFIRLIDPVTRREIAKFDDEAVTGDGRSPINSFVAASIAQGGDTVIEATAGNVFVWDVASGGITKIFEETTTAIFDATAAGDYVAWSTKDGDLHVYNLKEQEPLELVSCGEYGEGLSISPNGRYVSCVSFDRENPMDVKNVLKVWRLPDMKLVLERTEGIYDLAVTAFSPDEKLILVGGDDYDSNLIAIYIPTNEVVFREQLGGRETPKDIRFSPDGEFVVAALESQETRIWSIEGDWGEEVDTDSEELACVDTQYNEMLAGIESNDWEAAAAILAPFLEYHSEHEDVEQLAEHPEMQEALKEVYLSLWESQENVSKYGETAVPGDWNTTWALSSDWAVVGTKLPRGEDMSIVGLDSMEVDGNISFYNEEPSDNIWGVFSENEEMLAINDAFNVYIVDMNTFNTVRVIERSSSGNGCRGSNCEIQAVDFSRDGSLVAIGGRHGDVEIWDVATGAMRGEIEWVRAADDTHDILEVKFTPDNEYVLVTQRAGYSYDDDLFIFRVTPNGFGEQVFNLNIDPGSAGGISFSPDGETFYFAASWEVWVWDTDGWYDRTLYRDEALSNSGLPYLLDVGPIIFAVGKHGGVSVRKTGLWEGYELDIQSDRSDVRLLTVSEDYRDLWKAGEIITHWRVKPARVCP